MSHHGQPQLDYDENTSMAILVDKGLKSQKIFDYSPSVNAFLVRGER